MSTAISIFYYIYNKALSLLFDDLTIETGVTVGWIFVAVMILGFIICNVISVPRAVDSRLYYGDSRYHNRNFANRGGK